ncbi:MAG: hypothetical protein CBC24_06065 [Candidatus Pelagibacter sp. TMED64]|nr:acetyl-CoA carboxylase carboxyl transferase subunit beta [Candidatus Pelagibacter sp.]OUU64997.1 MAG: hypothetical protein CBC24_06065 [Candidatus Pelagibacter sp. TMED64]|tara:strand:+ start:10188 stop:11123 length:936 start_codon:yes stop_codon:yes gene_type:complete
MNWISKFIKPKIKSFFKKRPSSDEDSLWIPCGGSCQELLYKEDLIKNMYVCNKCENHLKISSKNRFNMFFDNGAFEILSAPKAADDPLDFVDTKKYVDRLKDARKKTNQNDAIMVASGKLNGIVITCGAQNFSFIGGSFGAQSGEEFINGINHAIQNKTPFVFFSCSGGQRMMESAIALQNMSRTVLAVNELKKENLPYIVVMTNPTFGGVTASWVMLGDILIAEPKSKIGFSGSRVIQQTIGESLPEGFQTAEYIFEHGGCDMVVSRKNLRNEIGSLLSILLKKREFKAINENENVNTINEPLSKVTKAI